MEQPKVDESKKYVKKPRVQMDPPTERRWAQHCGCDGSCSFQYFNDEMELIDTRLEQQHNDASEEVSPTLLLHLLMMW